MDWSLVLASQSIETMLDRRTEDGAWILVVAADDFHRANDAIRAYEKENASPWRQEIAGTGLLFDWSSAIWWLGVIAISVCAWLWRTDLQTLGVMDKAQFAKGQWWRVFTAVTLHADAGHLALNASIGFLLLGLAMGCYRTGTALFTAYAAAAAANCGEVIIRTGPYRSLGASGMVMAALGLLAAHSVFDRTGTVRQRTSRGVLAACLLFVLLGLDTRSDILVHALGFVAGAVVGTVLSAARMRFTTPKALDVAAAVACAVTVATAWAFALR